MTNIRQLVENLVERELSYQDELYNGWDSKARHKAWLELKSAREAFESEMQKIERKFK